MTAIYAPRVLVVEDTDTTRRRLVNILNARGYEAMVAGSGREAFDVLMTTQKVDAILLDLIMPQIDGWEFRRHQLSDPRLAEIPTIVISVKPLAEHDRYALQLGSATVIQKPFEDYQVLEALARTCEPTPRAVIEPAPWRTSEGQILFWSRRGFVACEGHAPRAGSPEWREDGWAPIPTLAGKNRVEYRCQFCGDGPIRHGQRRRKL